LPTEARIRQAIIGVSGIAILSKLLGFLREMVIAERFGTSRQYDILLIGIAAPIFFNLVLVNATNFLVVPFLSKKMSQDSNSGWRSFWSLANSFLIIVILLVLAIIAAAPLLVKIVGPSLAGDSLQNGILYCRIISLLVLLGFLESFFRSALNVKKEFVYPATGTIILNVIAISIIYLFSGSMSVMAILIGLLVGSFCQVLFLFLKLLGFKVSRHFHMTLFDADARGLLAVGGMIIIVELISRTYFLIDRFYASDLAPGVVSALNYGSLLVMLPVSVAGLAIANVTFPYLSDRLHGDQPGRFAELLRSTIQLSLVVGVPCGIFYLFFAHELTAAVFLRGAFDLDSLAMTSRLLIFLVPHLVSLFLYSILIQACYASGRQKYVLVIAVAAVILKFIMTGIFKELLNYSGIALATSVVEVLTLGLLMMVLARDNQIVGVRTHLVTLGKVVLASLPMMAIGIYYLSLPDFVVGMNLIRKMRVVPAFIFSAIGFVMIGYMIRIPEVRDFIDNARRRIGA
jgi:putative peptidoglycan lipid II flippase